MRDAPILYPALPRWANFCRAYGAPEDAKTIVKGIRCTRAGRGTSSILYTTKGKGARLKGGRYEGNGNSNAKTR
jgi:hypothetical protein